MNLLVVGSNVYHAPPGLHPPPLLYSPLLGFPPPKIFGGILRRCYGILADRSWHPMYMVFFVRTYGHEPEYFPPEEVSISFLQNKISFLKYNFQYLFEGNSHIFGSLEGKIYVFLIEYMHYLLLPPSMQLLNLIF